MNHKAAAFFAFALATFPALAGDPPRDPFEPYVVVAEEPVMGGEKRCSESAVACVELDAVSLKAVVTGTATPRALVETKDGRSSTLRVGDLVGKGQVKAISRRGVVVERIYFNAMGGSVRTNVLLTIG